jgi:DNA-binding GntR family transcriptional regulator
VKVPVCWAEYFIHREFAAVGRLLPRHTGPIFPLIEDLFGQRIVEVHQEIGATLITAALARPLKVRAGTAALEVQRSYTTASGRIAQVTISTHPAARFRHSMTMRRMKV